MAYPIRYSNIKKKDTEIEEDITTLAEDIGTDSIAPKPRTFVIISIVNLIVTYFKFCLR